MPGEMFARITASPDCDQQEIYVSTVFPNDVIRVPVLLPASLDEVAIEFTAISSGEGTLTTRKRALPI